MNKVGIGRGLVAILLVSPDVRVENLLSREDFGICAALAIRRYQLGETDRSGNSGKEIWFTWFTWFTFHAGLRKICLQNELLDLQIKPYSTVVIRRDEYIYAAKRCTIYKCSNNS